jgi:hypothetical protein
VTLQGTCPAHTPSMAVTHIVRDSVCKQLLLCAALLVERCRQADRCCRCCRCCCCCCCWNCIRLTNTPATARWQLPPRRPRAAVRGRQQSKPLLLSPVQDTVHSRSTATAAAPGDHPHDGAANRCCITPSCWLCCCARAGS